jgi:DNA polymerase-4
VRARTIEIKIRSSEFRTQFRAQSLPEATNLTDLLWQAAKDLFEKSLTPDLVPVRLLGIGASRLTREAVTQGGLFDTELRQRQQALDKAVDGIRGEFGADAVRRASQLDRDDDSK